MLLDDLNASQTRRRLLLALSGAGVAMTAIAADAKKHRRKHRKKKKRKKPVKPLVLGIFEEGMPESAGRIGDFEARWGRAPGLVMWFQAWGSDSRRLDTELLDRVAAAGAAPEITWEPWKPGDGKEQPDYALSAIAQGRHDDYVATWAEGLRDWGGVVYLRFAHEMNGEWYPWAVGKRTNGNTADDYVAAWRHVHGVFTERGATNVRWVWCPNVKYPGAAPLDDLYPGGDYVDWIGMDGYNWGWGKEDPAWASVSRIFGPTYGALAGKGKPMMICETACTNADSPGANGEKSDWILNGLLKAVPGAMPKVRAVTYFNLNKERLWSVENTPGNIAAFQQVCDSLKYSAAMPGYEPAPPPA